MGQEMGEGGGGRWRADAVADADAERELHLTETQCWARKINDVAERIFQNEAKDKNKEGAVGYE